MAQERASYWPDPMGGTRSHEIGYDLELRGQLVLRFVEAWGMVQGVTGREDSAGRAKLELMSPPQVVARAVDMASCVVAALEEAGWIAAPTGDAAALAQRVGELARLRAKAEYPPLYEDREKVKERR